MIDEGQETFSDQQQKVAISTRVSAAENKSPLDSQTERLVAQSATRGYQMRKIVKEVGSGSNDARPTFLALLEDPSISVIVVEHKDRASRCGVRSIESFLRIQGRTLEVVNQGLKMGQKTCSLI